MKSILGILTALFGLMSCTTKTEPNLNVQNIVSSDTIQTQDIDTLTELQALDTLNYTDSNGLKQGLWKQYMNGKLWKVENYQDDQLNGKCSEFLANGEVMEMTYLNGTRHGYYLHYNPDSTFGKFVTFWENGEKVWSAFPWELESYIVPIKGFLTEKDSIEIKVPYNSGKLMYRGTIAGQGGNHGEALGIHKAFYESGELKAIINYDTDSIEIYTKSGVLIESTLIGNWRGKRIDK